MDNEEIRYLTKPLLQELNEHAITRQAENHLSRGMIKRLDGTFKFPVVEYFPEGGKVRLTVGLSPWDLEYLDVTMAQYEALPIFVTNMPVVLMEELMVESGDATKH